MTRAFDGLERGLEPVAVRQALPAFAAAALLGRTRNRLSGRWPAPAEVAALLPHLDRSAAERLAWSIGGNESRNRLVAACLRRGAVEPVRSLLRASGELAALQPPLILGTFHVGAVHAVGPALERLPGPVLALRHGLLHASRAPVETLSTEGDDQRRAAVFHRALLHLESGGFLVLAVDVVPGPGLRVPCLGRVLEMARGPFALARLTGAPIRPLVARWRRGGVEIEAGEAWRGETGGAWRGDVAVEDPGAGQESVLAAAAGRWLESYLLESPEELGLGLLRALLGGRISLDDPAS